MVYIVDINTNDPDRIIYRIQFFRWKKMAVTNESLKSRNITDIKSIPIHLDDYINESKNFTQVKI